MLDHQRDLAPGGDGDVDAQRALQHHEQAVFLRHGELNAVSRPIGADDGVPAQQIALVFGKRTPKREAERKIVVFCLSFRHNEISCADANICKLHSHVLWISFYVICTNICL